MALAQLIQPATLAEQLIQDNLIIFDCRFALDNPSYGATAYSKAHLPNAIFLDLEKDLSSPVIKGVTSRHPLPDADKLIKQLASLGLNNDSQVVIYDDGATPFATKMWWTLVWLGKRDKVFILDGGFNAWQEAGLPVDNQPPHYPAGDFAGQADNSLLISATELEKKLADPSLTLLDARALPRFLGKEEPLDPVAGHIPGASCANFTENLDSQGRFLPILQLQERFKKLINQKPLDNVFAYCGSGVSACHNLFALCLAGYPLVPLYAGSWSEWITDPNRAISTAQE